MANTKLLTNLYQNNYPHGVNNYIAGSYRTYNTFERV